ncbi:MAG: mannonate dehydratase [Bacteroidales bacterium]|nr:mannonate dehydratase [Bacteroidales bacterium]
MEITWRWFGPGDKVSLHMLRQLGVEGVVTALHRHSPGEVWPEAELRATKERIEAEGLRWSVVESLPVSEQIKYGGPDRDPLLDRYRQSLENLGRCGIRTVCYNFMPVIDWVRTDLERPMPDGSHALFFDYLRFAYFDIKLLAREGAEKDFLPEVVERVEALDRSMSGEEKAQLVDTIVTRTQGFINGPLGGSDAAPLERFRALLAPYKDVSKAQLRENLRYFLEAVMPVCREWDIRLCIHPDDPPTPVFGLPRIVCDAEDIRWLLGAVDDFHNGLTFCAGSLSAGKHNDVEAMARAFAGRTHFVHLRSCELLPGGDFVEAPHTAGRANLVELIRIFEREGRNIPMRVDHGRAILGDERAGYPPGYGFHGRMLALGQVQGMMAAVRDERNRQL